MNLILAYAVADPDKRVPSFDSNGRLRWKWNVRSFGNLTTTLREHSFGQQFLRIAHSVVYNVDVRHDGCQTRVLRARVNGSHTLDLTLYSKIELAPNVFDYLWVSYVYDRQQPRNPSLRKLISGTLYRPSQMDAWGKEQMITSFRFERDTMWIEFLDIHGDWVVDPHTGLLQFEVHFLNRGD